MRPPSVYANLSCPAGCPCEVTGPLDGPHRVGVRLVMILLSHRGWTAVAIAELLGCDPSTVRRWIHRYNQHGAAGLVDRPRLVAKGDPDRDVVLAELHQQLAELPAGTVVLAEDETHVNLLPWVRATWIRTGSARRS